VERRPKPVVTQAAELKEGRDYYLERGRIVFTASFLKSRGQCCESGCRHCPYGFGPEGLRKRSGPQEKSQPG
jgi:hypothetical protein